MSVYLHTFQDFGLVSIRPEMGGSQSFFLFKLFLGGVFKQEISHSFVSSISWMFPCNPTIIPNTRKRLEQSAKQTQSEQKKFSLTLIRFFVCANFAICKKKRKFRAEFVVQHEQFHC